MLGGLLIATILVPEIMIPLAVVGVGLGGYQVYQGYKLYQQGIEQKDAAMMLGGYRAMATGTTDVVLVAVTTYLGMKTGARKVMAPGNSGSTIRLSEALKALKASWKDYTKEQLFEALGGNLKDGATVEEAEALGTVLNRIDRPATAGRTITLTQDQVNAIEALEQLEARGLLKNPKPPVVEPPPEPGILRPRRVVIEVLQDSCFVAGTRLLTPDGDKPIESFSRGDLVLSRSEHNPEGQVEPRRVEEVFIRNSAIVELSVGGRTIGTTAKHPFYVRNKGWRCVKELETGDELCSHDGQWLPLERIFVTGRVEHGLQPANR